MLRARPPPVKHHSTRSRVDTYGMARKNDTTKDILAKNVDFIIRKRDLSEVRLSKLTGGEVAPKTINNIRNGRKAASVDTVELLAKALRLEPWQLLTPNLIDELKGGTCFGRLYKSYIQAPPEGREIISQLAEREAQRAAPPPNS